METQERIKRFAEILEENGINNHYEAIDWLADEIPEDEFKPHHVDDEDWGTHRWYERVLSIYEIDKDVFVGIFWDQGHTENQENSWPDGNVYLLSRREVKSYDYTKGDSLVRVTPLNNY